MPTGPLGTPRPFADGDLIYEARYTVPGSVGESMEGQAASESAESLIAQAIEDQAGFFEPAVELAPAGRSLLVQVNLGDERILPTGSRTQGITALRNTVDDAVKSAVSQNASKEGLGDPEWEIYCK